MSYASIVKHFVPLEEPEPKKVEMKKKEIRKEEDTEYNYKDYEEEYDKKYTLLVHDLKFAFKDYIIENGYPFMNGEAYYYNFFDYIKYNSDTYAKVRMEVDEYNEGLKVEEEKELEEIEQEEIEEFEHFNSMSEYYS
jgi:hypothetical protein